MFHIFKEKSGSLTIIEVKDDARYKRLVKFNRTSSVADITVDYIDFKRVNSADIVNGKLVYQKQKVDIKAQEQEWQRIELSKVNVLISEYQADIAIDELYSELRISTYSESDYFKLLGDRKLLIEYVQQDDFPECGRPTLSSLI